MRTSDNDISGGRRTIIRPATSSACITRNHEPSTNIDQGDVNTPWQTSRLSPDDDRNLGRVEASVTTLARSRPPTNSCAYRRDDSRLRPAVDWVVDCRPPAGDPERAGVTSGRGEEV